MRQFPPHPGERRLGLYHDPPDGLFHVGGMASHDYGTMIGKWYFLAGQFEPVARFTDRHAGRFGEHVTGEAIATTKDPHRTIVGKRLQFRIYDDFDHVVIALPRFSQLSIAIGLISRRIRKHGQDARCSEDLSDRSRRLARIEMTEQVEHRIGGLEKSDVDGNVCYEPENHSLMVRKRAAKIAGIAKDIPLIELEGADRGELLVVSWGSTYGAVSSAVERCREHGLSVSLAHLHYIEPFSRNLGEILKGFKRILMPELNLGQLRLKLSAAFLVETIGLNKVEGKPFKIQEIVDQIEEILQGQNK